MANDVSEDAPHPASQVHLARARDRGYICRSNLLAQAIQIAGMMIVLGVGLQPLMRAVTDSTRQIWSQATTPAAVGDFGNGWQIAFTVATPLAAILAGLFLIACLSHLAQTGFAWRPSPPEFDLLAGPRSAIRHLLSMTRLLPLALVWLLLLATGWWVANSETIWQVEWQSLWLSTSQGAIGDWWDFGWRLLLPLIVALLVLGGLDYVWRRWNYLASLKLTDQQMRDEQKEDDNPALRRLRKRRVA